MFAPNPESMVEAEAQIQQILAEEKVPELDFGGIFSSYLIMLERVLNSFFFPQPLCNFIRYKIYFTMFDPTILVVALTKAAFIK